MEHNYLIKSKVQLEITKSSAWRFKALKICIIGSMLLVVFSFITDNYSYQVSRLLLISIVLYFIFKKRVEDQSETILTTVNATLQQDQIIMDYSKLDRRDGLGSRREVITFYFQNIYGLEYNNNQLCLRISGKPTIQVQYENQKRHPGTKVITDREDVKIHYLYLDSDCSNEFIEELTKLSSIRIEYKE